MLLHVEDASGHMSEGDTDQQRRQTATDFYSFIMAQTGLPAYQPEEGTVQTP